MGQGANTLMNTSDQVSTRIDPSDVPENGLSGSERADFAPTEAEGTAPEIEAARAEIEETRAQMTETIDAIKEK
jgi:hypothetical protein